MNSNFTCIYYSANRALNKVLKLIKTWVGAKNSYNTIKMNEIIIKNRL